MELVIHWHGKQPRYAEYESHDDAVSAIASMLNGIINPGDVSRCARIAVKQGALLLTALGQVTIKPQGVL